MRGVQSRGGSLVMDSGVDELVEDGGVVGSDLEVEDGVLGHGVLGAPRPMTPRTHSPPTPHDRVTKVTDFSHNALPEGHHHQPAESFESSLGHTDVCPKDDNVPLRDR